MLASRISTAIYQLEELELLFRQTIRQAMIDLVWVRTALDQGRAVNGNGVLQRNGQQVDLYAARLTDATTHLRALLALAAELLHPEPPAQARN